MKKLFAILSVLALTFAIVGLTKVSASDKFTVDPTITENDIPVYVMGSIRTTFPAFYDYEAEPDGNWQGASRQYPWNETRLKIRQVSESGFTGKNYLVYFSGGTSASSNGTANNVTILTAADNEYGFYLSRYDANAGTATATYDGVTFNYKANIGPMDTSLSHGTLNVSGKDLDVDLLNFANATAGQSVGSWAQQVYCRAIVFDAQGRAIWGNANDRNYATADAPTEAVLPAEYCYVNGVATRFTDVNACDKALTPVLDEEGVPVLDEVTGEAKMTEGTEPDYVKGRYVWMWISNEDWENTYKARTNTVDYLAEGWDPDKWDDEFEYDGGHMLIAFVNAAQLKFAINDAQAAAANVGKEDSPYAAGYIRKYVEMVKIPAGGIVYDFGYLDRGTEAEVSFSEFMLQAYKYGRTLDADGKGMGSMTTYNFSAKPIYQSDKVIDGNSYQYLEGTQTIEVMKGASFKPASLVTYSGLGRFWGIENNILSYSNSTDSLRLTLTVNGDTKVQYVESYKTFDDMVEAYVASVNAWLESLGSGGFGDKHVTHVDKPTIADCNKNSNWFAIRWTGILAVGGKSQFLASEYGAPWGWLYEYIGKNSTSSSGLKADGTYSEDGGCTTIDLLTFLCQSGDYTVTDSAGNPYPHGWQKWTKELCEGWMDKETLADKFAKYTIDTTEDAVDTVYDVVCKCENPDTGNASTYVMKFVVVDEYTPILEIAKANYLKFTPIIADNGSMTFKGANGIVETIDPAQFATAYNARYNGLSIKGDDISYKIHYTSATLDFDAPTEGEHKVTAKVYNGVKYAEKTFTVKVEDITAPTAAVVEKVTVQYGSLFNPYDLIQYAFDNVDGNLLNVKGAVSVASSVNTTKPKEYTVTFTFSDEAGNYVEKTSKVTVAENPEEKVAELKEAIEAQQAKINALNDEIAEVKAQAEAIAAQTAGCGASSGAIMAGFFAMASLLVVVLKKRH